MPLGGALAPGTWHQIAFVRAKIDSVDAPNGVVYYVWFYLDGAQVGQPQMLFNLPNANVGEPLAFGNYGFHNTGACELNGDLDELHIFNTCVTDAFIYDEYRRIHDSATPLPCPPCNTMGFQLAWGSLGSGNAQFSYPTGTATDNAGNVYVAEQGNNRIQKFNGSGVYLTQWGTPGTGPGQFNRPYGVATDNSGFVYVTDADNHRVEKFTSAGGYVGQWGLFGTGNGQFNTPALLATDGAGNVYVADYGNHRIQVFNSSGAYMTQWGSLGTGDGQFSHPTGVAVDLNNNVYVTDYDNSRVERFTNAGVYSGQWGSLGTAHGQFSSPAGIVTDVAGNVFVADVGNNRIEKFSSGMNYLTGWGAPGSANGQFNVPIGVSSSASGYVYVADSRNHRVQEFGCSASVLGVAEHPSQPQDRIISAPNPFASSTRISFSMIRSESDATISIVDVAGRTVRTLYRGPLTVGAQSLLWDGRNGQGREASNGIYFVAIRGGSTNLVRSILRLK